MGKNQKKPKKKLAGQRIPQKVERLDPSVLIIQSRFPDLLSKNRELHRAVLSGSISYVIDLLKSGADPRAVAGDHFTIESKHSVLYVASYLGFEPIVRELLRNGADPRVKTMDGSTPIIAACQQGHTRVVEILYDAAPDMLDTPDLDGELPLIVAVSNRHHETAAFLVAKRANVNATNARGANSLFFPVQFRAFNTVELLLQNGVKINHARISDGNTVLHNAVALGYLEIVALLLKNGADSTIINLQGFTAKNFMKEEQTEEMSELLEHPEIADQILSRPRFCLRPVFVHPDEQKPEFLLKSAVQRRNIDEIRNLVTQGVDINLILDNDGNTALLLALKQGSYELVKEILLLNPNLFSEDRFGQTVFDICTVDLVTSLFSNRESRKETLSELKNSNNSPSSLWDKNGDLKGIEQIKKALHRNCDLEKKSSRGITPLITATRKKNTFESLLVLIKAGCDINARDLSDKNLSQILDSRDCVFSVEEKKQIRKTMQSVMKSKSQAETLVSAVNAGYYNVVLSAINNGEDVNQAIGKNGETLLMQSVRHHFYGIAKLLVNAGADMEIKNHKGLSAKEIAVDMKIENEVIEFIFTKAQETHLVENNLDSLDEKRIPVFS